MQPIPIEKALSLVEKRLLRLLLNERRPGARSMKRRLFLIVDVEYVLALPNLRRGR